MDASEMTNEELAKALMSRVPLDSDRHDDLREAAARLRKFDITLIAQKAKSAAEGYAHGREEVANLRRRLKVAEEALSKITKEQECGQDCTKCTNHGCVIKECKAALAKAAGESEVKE